MPQRSKSLLLAALGALGVAGSAVLTTVTMGRQPDGSIIIPTGQSITPAGTHLEVATGRWAWR